MRIIENESLAMAPRKEASEWSLDMVPLEMVESKKSVGLTQAGKGA